MSGSPGGAPPDKTRSPFWAAVLSLFIPGLGQAYCGALGKATGFLLTFTLCLSLFAIFDISIGFYLVPLVWVAGIADAYRTADGIDSGRSPWRESRLLPFGILAVIVGIVFAIGFMVAAFAMVFAPTSCAPGVGCYGPLEGEPPCGDIAGCISGGMTRLQVHYYGDAGTFFQKALSYDPGNATALALLGVSEELRGDHNGALALLDRSLAADPDQSAVWNNRGVVAGRMGDTSAAGTGFRNAVTLDSDESVGWYNLGTGLFLSGDDTAAIAALDHAIALSPNSTGYRIMKGRALTSLGNYSGAMEIFRTVTNITPGSVPSLRGEGEALAGLERYGESCTVFDAAISADHYNLADIWSGVCNATTGTCEPPGYSRSPLTDDDREFNLRLLADYNNDLKWNPGDADTIQKKGAVLIKLQRYDEAITAYDTANSIGEGNAEALNGRGLAQFFKGDTTAALDSFSSTIRKNPSFIRSWNNRAFVLWREGQAVGAAADYRQAVRIESMKHTNKDDYILIVTYSGRKL